MILSIYLIFSAIMFCFSILGILLNQNNFLLFFLYLQLTLLAVSTNFITYAKLWSDLNGQIFVFFILIIIAMKLVLGLSILLKLSNIQPNIMNNAQQEIR